MDLKIHVNQLDDVTWCHLIIFNWVFVSLDENQQQRAADAYISVKLCHLELYQN